MSQLADALYDRIGVVRRGVLIDPARLQTAQEEKQLTNRVLAERLYVTERTWYRWKKEGKIPAYRAPDVARELNIEIELAASGDEGAATGLREQLEMLRASQEELKQLLRELLSRGGPSSQAPR